MAALPAAAFFLALFLSSVTVTTAAPVLKNFTVAVPEGTSDHGDPRLLCLPTHTIDILTFFFVNYVAHAATVVTEPGEPVGSILMAMIFAFALPASGAARGLQGIIRATSIRQKNSVKAAMKCGALCEVVRTSYWQPMDGDVALMRAAHRNRRSSRDASPSKDHPSHVWSQAPAPSLNIRLQDLLPQRPMASAGQESGPDIQPVIQDSSQAGQGEEGGSGSERVITTRVSSYQTRDEEEFEEFIPFTPHREWFGSGGLVVHGLCDLPQGYALCRVSKGTDIDTSGRDIVQERSWREIILSMFTSAGEEAASSLHLASAYSMGKGLVGVLQLGYGSYTLYRARGDQVARYGYAAFGLTVAPYVMMSLINLLSSVLSAQYPCMYMVRTNIMAEAERRGGRFVGEIGSVRPPPPDWSWDDVAPENFTAEFSVGPESSLRFRPRSKVKNLSELYGPPSEDGYYSIRIRNERADTLLLASSSSERGHQTSQIFLLAVMGPYVSLIPLAIIGGISSFHNGDSSTAQRGWTMSWFVISAVYGPMMFLFSSKARRMEAAVIFFYFLVFAIPAIGGLVVVAQMMREYGSCTLVY